MAVTMLPASGQSQEVIEDLLKEALNDTNKKVRKIAFIRLTQAMRDDESKRKDIILCLLPLLTDPSWRIRRTMARQLYYLEGLAKYVSLDCVVRAFLGEEDLRVQRHLRKLMRAVLDVRGHDKENK